MTTIVAGVWALWIGAGGVAHSGRLYQPYIAAYFRTVQDCQFVQKHVDEHSPINKLWTQCIQSDYIIPGK